MDNNLYKFTLIQSAAFTDKYAYIVCTFFSKCIDNILNLEYKNICSLFSNNLNLMKNEEWLKNRFEYQFNQILVDQLHNRLYIFFIFGFKLNNILTYFQTSYEKIVWYLFYIYFFFPGLKIGCKEQGRNTIMNCYFPYKSHILEI